MSKGLMSEGNAARNILLVEGPDDVGVCYHLMSRYKVRIPEQVCIKDKGGVENILDTLDSELDASGLERLGILVDADEDLSTRWQSLYDKLISLGFTSIPHNPDPKGTVISENGRPRVGIWLMPDNQLSGMLEHFCSFLVPPGDRLWSIAESTLEQAVQQECRFPEEHMMKAHIHTWLAWQKEPGKPMGQAITKKFFNSKAPHAQLFMEWIRRLFELA